MSNTTRLKFKKSLLSRWVVSKEEYLCDAKMKFTCETTFVPVLFFGADFVFPMFECMNKSEHFHLDPFNKTTASSF